MGIWDSPIMDSATAELQQYNEKRRDEIERDAEAYNCTVIDATDKTLLLDLDNDAAYQQYLVVLPMLNNQFPDMFEQELSVWPKTEEWISKSGTGRHVVLYLSAPLDAKHRIMLQAILGSDGKREALNLNRVVKGLEENIVLFKPRPKALPAPAPLPVGYDDIPY